MNKLIVDNLSINRNFLVDGILPHQLGTLDFLCKTILDEKKNVLLFHAMGSGKTLISLLFALIYSIKNKVTIILPNSNISSIYEESLPMAELLIGISNYNTENIKFYTNSKFTNRYAPEGKIEKSTINYFKNNLFIIDEAHNIFGTSIGKIMLDIKKGVNSRFLLLTGSPITNTPITLYNIISMIDNEIESLNINDLISQGNLVFQNKLKERGKQEVIKALDGKISFYNSKDTMTIPSIIFVGEEFRGNKAIFCEMTDLQYEGYENIRNGCYNEMFDKIMTDVSFATLGKINTYKNIESYSSIRDSEIYPGLKLNNGRLYGSELLNLNFSSKLKYFINNIINIKNKHYVFFSNSSYGSFVLRYVMIANGYTEYKTRPAQITICVHCNFENTCKKCVPAYFAIVTSRSIHPITELLAEFNSPENDEGEKIKIIFCSKIMTESYTFKEVRNVWFLTIPDTYTQYVQILGRSLRKFSYKDTTIPVKVFILMATRKNFTLQDEDVEMMKSGGVTDIPFDIKKSLYLEFKTVETNKIYEIFEQLSKNDESKPHKLIEKMCVLEICRQYFYNNSCSDNIDKILKLTSKLLIDGTEHINEIIENKYFFTNKTFGKSLVIKIADKIITVPLQIENKKFVYSLKI